MLLPPPPEAVTAVRGRDRLHQLSSQPPEGKEKVRNSSGSSWHSGHQCPHQGLREQGLRECQGSLTGECNRGGHGRKLDRKSGCLSLQLSSTHQKWLCLPGLCTGCICCSFSSVPSNAEFSSKPEEGRMNGRRKRDGYFRGRKRAKQPQLLPSGTSRSEARMWTQMDLYKVKNRTGCRGKARQQSTRGLDGGGLGADVRRRSGRRWLRRLLHLGSQLCGDSRGFPSSSFSPFPVPLRGR